jgi:endoglucanase
LEPQSAEPDSVPNFEQIQIAKIVSRMDLQLEVCAIGGATMDCRYSRTTFGFFLLLAALAGGCGDRETPGHVSDHHDDPIGDRSGVVSGALAEGLFIRQGTGMAGAADTRKLHQLLIDDFEDGDELSAIGGWWYGYTDSSDGGASTLTVSFAPGYRSKYSGSVAYTFDQGTSAYAPYVGVGIWFFGDYPPPFDFSAYTSLSYNYRGGAHRVRIETFDVKDYDYFGADLPASAHWTTVNLPLASLAQQGWGTAVPFDPSNIRTFGMSISGATGESGQLQVDNLRLLSEKQVRIRDMAINPPAPPAKAAVHSLAIRNPLQAKAMKYLNRGYSVVGWLEQERFSGFTRDEAFVRQAAAAGFQGLRLPIDFALYIDSTTGAGDALSISVNHDLFTVLDAFNAWTKKYGISLTVDYHPIFALSLSDADSLTKAVLLWDRIAQHFAKERREDLFFELLNEPGLAFGGTTPTQAQWTALAERMVGAIRTRDTRHTILFGDILYYDIDELVAREPLADPNVIYAFHFYEPHLFAEQGADFGGMPSTHDIPYPYDPHRWSEYSTDFGLYFRKDSWVMALAYDYYKAGNRSALFNHVADAKRWGVAHNVPVICNEFGAYARTSRVEDRIRYYTDIVGIFQELQIAWQTLYPVMDDDGNIDPPELRAAFGFDGRPGWF